MLVIESLCESTLQNSWLESSISQLNIHFLLDDDHICGWQGHKHLQHQQQCHTRITW